MLTHAGAVSHQLAEAHAHAQFEHYDTERRRLEAEQPSSDFDRAVEEVKQFETSQASRRANKAIRKLQPKGGKDD